MNLVGSVLISISVQVPTLMAANLLGFSAFGALTAMIAVGMCATIGHSLLRN